MGGVEWDNLTDNREEDTDVIERFCTVAALFEIDCTVRATGKQIRDEQIHLWQFGADGKVSALRHFLDTAKAIEAHS